jgi:hypothetical protein
VTSARSAAAPPPHLMLTSAAAAGVPARQPAAVQCHARQPHSQKQQARGRPLHDQRPGCSQGVGHCPVRGFRHRRGAGSLLSHRRHWPPYRECLTLICRHCIALLTACRLLHCNGHPAARTADCNRAESCALAVGWCLQDKPRGFPLPEMEQNDYEPLKKGGPLLPPPAAAACCLLPGAAPCSCRSHCSPHLTHLTPPAARTWVAHSIGRTCAQLGCDRRCTSLKGCHSCAAGGSSCCGAAMGGCSSGCSYACCSRLGPQGYRWGIACGTARPSLCPPLPIPSPPKACAAR